MTTNPEFRSDGRMQRSERSREAIVQALIDLVGEGVLEPTAQQVAERAAVGVRTVFRHFSDMETLFAAMNDRLSERIRGFLVESDQGGPFETRLEGVIERRAKIFGIIEPYRRARDVHRWRSPFLQEQNDVMIKIFRRDLGLWLPEISTLDHDTAEALEVILSFETWDRLRSAQRLGTKRTQSVIRRMALAVTAHRE
jgi:AcrR family transcriptional regulator